MSYARSEIAHENANKILTQDEINALYLKINKQMKKEDEEISIETAISWIARLGGFLNRKNDGFPGMTVIGFLMMCFNLLQIIPPLIHL